MLRVQGDEIVKDYQTWYDYVDEPLSMLIIRINQDGRPFDEGKKGELANVSAQRSQLRADCFRELENKIKNINPIRAEAFRLLGSTRGSTKEDQDKMVIFESVVAGNSSILPNVNVVQVGEYLKELSKRVSNRPRS